MCSERSALRRRLGAFALAVFASCQSTPGSGAETMSATRPGTTAATTNDDWRALAANNGALDDGTDVGALLLRLTAVFGESDPTLRDDCGYALAARWIYSDRRASPDDLRQVLGVWIEALDVPGTDAQPDAALKRSFTALALSLMAARDLATPFLEADEFERLLDAALTYLSSERDGRGYDARLGWVHATAHTADLIKFLARNPRLTAEAQQRIAAALAARITRPADQAFAWGEDQRLARAAGSIMMRPDSDALALEAFSRELREARERAEQTQPFDPRLFAAQLNSEHVLDVLLVGLGAIQPPPEQVARALDALRAAR